MGLIDLEIEVATGVNWKPRNKRLQRLKSRPTKSSTSVAQNSMLTKCDQYMDAKLHKAAAARGDDVDAFIAVLEKVSEEKRLNLDDIFNQVSPLGNTVLHVAASHQNEKITRLICHHCPSLITKQNSDGNTALHLAARNHDQALNKFMSNQYVYRFAITTLLRFREDWVHPLAADEWIEQTRLMSDDKKLLRVRNKKGNTALHEALIHNQIRAASILSEDPPVSYFPNMDDESPLYLAAKAGCENLVRNMLQDVTENKDERLKCKSPLLAAIMMRNKDMIDIILNEEPRFVDLQDAEGRMPLHHAAAMGYTEEVQYLILKYGASIIVRDNNGLLPIHLAAAEGHTETFQELLKHCPDQKEMFDHSGQSILHIAARDVKFDVLSKQKDYNGNKPLHLATLTWDAEHVRPLTASKRERSLKTKPNLRASQFPSCFQCWH